MRISAVILALASLVGAGSPGAAAQRPTVYAHRGGASLAPENTMAAFENASALFAQAGVDGWVEMDTHSAAGGELVVLHDHTLDRTTTCTGPVIEWRYTTACNAAEQWPAHGHVPVPLLADVMARGLQSSPAWGLMIEIKNIPGETDFDPSGIRVASALVALVEATGYPKDRIIVQSFWPASLDHVELLDPAIDTMLLTTSSLGFLLTENALYATARGYEISAPDFRAPDFTAETVAAAHLLGRRVITWTVDSPAEAARIAALGVDGIITNDPTILLP